jgi:hypothetical protein
MVYNFSVYYASSGADQWVVDNENCGEVLAQWHQTLDPGDTATGVGAPLTLNCFPKSGVSNLYLDSLYDDRKNTTTTAPVYANHTQYDLGALPLGQWTNWSFQVKWGWKTSQNPYLKVYENGVLVVNQTGPNTYNDSMGVNQQIGIYKPGWKDDPGLSKLSTRACYVDNIDTKIVYNNTAGNSLVTNGLVVNYNGTLSGTTCTDLSGNGNTGYVTLGTQETDLTNNRKYIKLNTQNTKISVKQSANVSSPMTVEFIGSINQFAQYEPIVYKLCTGTGWAMSCGFMSPYSNMHYIAALTNGEELFGDSIYQIPAGELHDFAITYDDEHVLFYVDGVPVGSEWMYSPIKGNTANVTIGGYTSYLAEWSSPHDINMYGFRLYNRTLTPTEIMQNYNYFDDNAPAPLAGPVIYYDGNLTGTAAVDQSGNTNNGYVINGTQGTNSRTGAKYIQLSGYSSKITTASNTQTNVSSPITIEYIGSINELSNYEPIVAKYNGSANGWWLAAVNSTTSSHLTRFGAYVGSLNAYNDETIMNQGTVHHIIVTYDDTTSYFYIDGVYAGYYPWNSPITGNDLNVTIGGYVPGLADSTDNYNTSMYLFKLYNRALSSSEVAQRYEAEKWRYVSGPQTASEWFYYILSFRWW